MVSFSIIFFRYRIWVRKSSTNFIVKLAIEKDPEEPRLEFKDMETVFKMEEHTLKSGYFALFTNAT
jgi:hypothetical protein